MKKKKMELESLLKISSSSAVGNHQIKATESQCVEMVAASRVSPPSVATIQLGASSLPHLSTTTMTVIPSTTTATAVVLPTTLIVSSLSTKTTTPMSVACATVFMSLQSQEIEQALGSSFTTATFMDLVEKPTPIAILPSLAASFLLLCLPSEDEHFPSPLAESLAFLSSGARVQIEEESSPSPLLLLTTRRILTLSPLVAVLLGSSFPSWEESPASISAQKRVIGILS